ncbi:MAG: hypothetical protein CVU55_08500 [Deltaproteobacteria bacterium HGW-Deltaproteobacteria-13]|jgi:enamine deaminase RidA (YjgF/YER057c/UK114 family)|nr:MAG: hypothetical protein CVU55_08500 [Deltaproteobacteria bacterium HGW-Deltaproteobacteria-13]
MKSDLKLQEDGFCLEFFSGQGDVFQNDSSEHKELLLNENMYILQEIIIVPPDMMSQANNFSAGTFAPLRCNKPLIFTGHPDLPVQYAAIAAKVEKEKVSVARSDTGIKITADGINLLYSAPVFDSHGSGRPFMTAFNKISEVLRGFQMSESAIARTWLFIRDILNDYEELNKAREQFFEKWNPAANQILPASTGIQNHIIGNEILAFEFCAFSGEHVTVKQISSPLQNEPTAYGKLFSRAVVAGFPRSKLLFVSGTAAIDKAGASVYIGNFKSQMEFTLEVISAILKQENCSFSNVVQAIVYLKRSKDMSSCFQILDQAGFPRERTLFQPGVDICRDNLLCEIEAMAVIS